MNRISVIGGSGTGKTTLASNSPADPHAYLCNLYGDYMQVPPPEKREKHMAVAVRFPTQN